MADDDGLLTDFEVRPTTAEILRVEPNSLSTNRFPLEARITRTSKQFVFAAQWREREREREILCCHQGTLRHWLQEKQKEEEATSTTAKNGRTKLIRLRKVSPAEHLSGCAG